MESFCEPVLENLNETNVFLFSAVLWITPTLAADQNNDPMKRQAYGDILAQKGQYKAALN